MSVKIKVALDTNIWSYIADADAGNDFERFVKSSRMEVVIPPSILLEVLRHPKPDIRGRILDTICRPTYIKLPSEAELESREIVSEIRRCRPLLLRQFPNTGATSTFHEFWTRRIWRDARTHAAIFYEKQNETPSTKKAASLIQSQKENRRNLLSDGGDFDPTDLSHIFASYEDSSTAEAYAPGWDGSPAEFWRVENLGIYRYEIFTVARRSAFTREDSTFADWLGAYVDLARLTQDARGFTTFWLEEVEKNNVRRHWTRWALRQAQMSLKVSDGNPYDDQHSSYLLDYDLFLTADRNYSRAINLVKEHAGFSLAEPRLVSGKSDSSILERIYEALR